MEGVRTLTVRDLASRMAAAGAAGGGGGVRLLDVRTRAEWEIARIEGFRLLDATLAAELATLGRETELVFLCHHGIRSEAAARLFLERGFHRCWNVTGGIDAWSREVDPAVPRY